LFNNNIWIDILPTFNFNKMKNTLTFLAIIVLAVNAYTQSPEKINYQAIVRDVGNNLLTNQAVNFQISILQGSASGTYLYSETQIGTTNAYGLVNLQIGAGTSTDDFSTIDWADGPYFIQLEIDVSGGTNFQLMGASQLLSVPYALYAKKADVDGSETKVTAGTNVTVTGLGTSVNPYIINSMGVGGFTHYIGELYGGGIIVAIWKEAGIEKGLIASLTDLSSGSTWSNVTQTLIGPSAQSWTDGQANTNAIIAQPGHTSSAAKLCNDYVSGGYSDWYLPALAELVNCFRPAYIVYNTLGPTNGFKLDGSYWSSTEYEAWQATDSGVLDSRPSTNYKSSTYDRVRCIRKF
jgi:hypothetical protein